MSKKVLLIYNDMALGGVQRIRSLIGNKLVEKGYDVELLLTSYNKNYYFKNNFKMSHVQDFFLLKNLFWFLVKIKMRALGRVNELFIFLSRKKIKKYFEQFDIIIDSRGAKRFNYIISNILADDSLCNKTYKTIHDSEVEAYLGFNIEKSKKIFSKYKGIISLSKSMDDLVSQKYGFNNRLIVPNPLNFEVIDNLMNEECEFEKNSFILAIGRLDAQKGFDILINSYHNSKLNEKNIKLLILGEGKDLSSLKNLATSLGIQDKVVFAGMSKNPYKYLKNTMFFVMSSRREGLPGALLEAFYCRTPSISFDCLTGPSDIISHMENGLLLQLFDKQEIKEFNSNKILRQEDIETLTSSMDLLYSDEDLRQKFINNTRAVVEKNNLDNIILIWEDLINNVSKKY